VWISDRKKAKTPQALLTQTQGHGF
jgi:hypothetical protein